MPAAMNTEPRRKASAALHKKRVEGGWRKVTFWLRPETVKKAESLRDQVGGIEAVVNRAVMDWQGVEPPKLTKPKTAALKAAEASLGRPNPLIQKFTGLTASGEPLPERKPIQKKGK